MTDQGDKEILLMAEQIKNKETKTKTEIYENLQKEWFDSKVGKYYREFFTGAHNEAFKSFYVRRIGDFGHYLETLDIMFAHIGHYSMGKGTLSYDEHTLWRFGKDETYYEEIDELKFLQDVNKFLKLTGLKDKMDKETNH